MAKKTRKSTTKKKVTKTPVRRSPVPKRAAVKKSAAKKTVVRKTTVPRTKTKTAPAAAAVVPPSREVTFEMIATRAYFISQSGSCRSEFENWLQAEWELNHDAL